MERQDWSGRIRGAVVGVLSRRLFASCRGLNGQDADATKGSVYVDASLSYSFSEHHQISLEGQNPGDTYERLYNDTQARRNEYFRNFGHQYTAGFRYSF